MKQSFQIRRVVLLFASVVFCFSDLFAQDTCELFSPPGLLAFHEEHIDMSKGVTTSPADSLHFFFKDGSLPVLEAFMAWGKDHGFTTGMKKDAFKREQMLHFIKLTTVLDDLLFERFKTIVAQVIEKKKQLEITDCGAMAVGHPNTK